MNLQILKNNIVAPDNEIALVQFIRENKLELERFFVSKSDEDIENEKFDLHDLCLDFINSTVFQAIRLKEIPEIVELLTLFAELFEKIGFIGGIAVIKASLPPKSSIRKRLDAVSLFMKIGNVKVDYIQKFNNILSNLQKAQDFAEFDYTGQVVQDTINYYLKGTKALKDSGNIEELTFFKSHFNSPVSRTNFKFLNHPSLKEYLDGYITEKVIVEVISDKIYTPSLVCQKIFQSLILDQIHLSGYLTRYSSDEIRADILNYGRADFTKPYKDLSPYDKTQLYCYFNMRKHFFTSYAIYEKIYMSLNSAVFNKDRNFTFIDLGCGPITSGLALASLHFDNLKKPLKVKYVYVDIANSMLQKASEFSSTELFDNQSEFHALSGWEDIDNQFIENIVKDNAFIVFNASYLFASSSLNEKSLADFVNKVVMKLNASAYFIFQNPDRADRNQKYQNFKRFISSNVEFSNTQKIYYRNKRNSYDEPSSENVNFEILSL